mgnify:CR=1 FL=1
MLMPQSKQMKLQWLTIDGRNVPFALPQHWNGDDWTITGVDNPLPTANYIEKNGIMVPVSENNPVPTQLTGSIVEEIIFDEVTITAGSSATVPADLSDVKEFSLGMLASYNYEWSLEIRPARSRSAADVFHELSSIPEGWVWEYDKNRYFSETYKNVAPFVRFTLRNMGNEDNTFNVYLYKLKRVDYR